MVLSVNSADDEPAFEKSWCKGNCCSSSLVDICMAVAFLCIYLCENMRLHCMAVSKPRDAVFAARRREPSSYGAPPQLCISRPTTSETAARTDPPSGRRTKWRYSYDVQPGREGVYM